MKERPILFSGSMVRAILDGRKTHTRRVAKVTSQGCRPGFVTPVGYHVPRKPAEHAAYCPYGRPGGRLWVRETWFDAGPYLDEPAFSGRGSNFVYRADDEFIGCHRWKPSIHMPRVASRLSLEIVNIRVEQLQDISGMDAKREGISVPSHIPADGADLDYARRDFIRLWDSINAKRGYGWNVNPWVWVVEFKRITA